MTSLKQFLYCPRCGGRVPLTNDARAFSLHYIDGARCAGSLQPIPPRNNQSVISGADVRVGDVIRVLGRHQSRRVSMVVTQIVEMDDGGRLLLGHRRHGQGASHGFARIVDPLHAVEVLA